MSFELKVLIASVGAALVTSVVVPGFILLARRTEFYDRPHGYKHHLSPTPYLGGAALMVGVLPITVILSPQFRGLGILVGGALVMLVLGTIDDRWPVAPGRRVVIEVLLALALWWAGMGWSVAGSDALSIILTILWVVGVVNALNLFDNMDGSACAVAAAGAAGVAILAVAHRPGLATLALAIGGGCIGFLRWNLARPARIFLGDGGSLPLGFLLAGAAMALPPARSHGAVALATAVPLLGVPILDTTLVSYSRWRRGVPLLQGGCDHLTHRLERACGTPARVAALVAAIQIALAVGAFGATKVGSSGVGAFLIAYVAFVFTAVALLERRFPAPRSAGVLEKSAPSAEEHQHLSPVGGGPAGLELAAVRTAREPPSNAKR